MRGWLIHHSSSPRWATPTLRVVVTRHPSLVTVARMTAFAVSAVIATANADVLDTRGMAPHEQCAYCHGLDGNSPMPRFPRLAGQNASYLRKQLADFKHGRRTNDDGAMSGIADALSDAEVEKIVLHYAAQSLRAGSPDVEGDAAAAGRRLYFNGRRAIAACATCHGTQAPVLSGAPRLMGQHGAYLAKQLQDFRRGARRNDAGGVMHRVAKSLADSEIRALVAFLSAQPVMTGASR
jgi:cytochrome c553